MGLINSGLDEIMFSIDSNKKNVFESIRKGLDFDVVLHNILKFISLRDQYRKEMKIRVRMVILEENQDEISEWLDYWMGKTNEETDKVYAMPNHFWGNHLREKKDESSIEKPCVSPFSTMIILCDGRVAMCSPDYDCKNEVGDFTKNSIKEIWNSEKLNELRGKHLRGERGEVELCRNCIYWDRKYIGKF